MAVDITKLIDLDGLAVFYNGLKQKFVFNTDFTSYQRNITELLSGKANKAGNAQQAFSASMLNLGTTPYTLMTTEIGNSPFLVVGQLGSENNEVTTIPIGRGDVAMADDVATLNKVYENSNLHKFTEAERPQVFRDIIDQSGAQTAIVVKGNVGDIIYYIASGTASANTGTHFGNSTGFYMVTEANLISGAVTATTYIGPASRYELYYCYGANQGYFYIYKDGIFSRISQSSTPVDPNPENFGTATSQDILDILDGSFTPAHGTETQGINPVEDAPTGQANPNP